MNFERDLRPGPDEISQAVMDLAHDMANEEHGLRSVGASPDRIVSAHRKRHPALVKLAIRNSSALTLMPPLESAESHGRPPRQLEAIGEWGARTHANNIEDGEPDARSRAFKD